LINAPEKRGDHQAKKDLNKTSVCEQKQNSIKIQDLEVFLRDQKEKGKK
jgi:hypothetical protein